MSPIKSLSFWSALVVIIGFIFGTIEGQPLKEQQAEERSKLILKSRDFWTCLFSSHAYSKVT